MMGTKETMMQLAPDVPFPWRLGEGIDAHLIFDAKGDPIAEFYGPAKERAQAMSAVVCAVNTLAGYRAEIVPPNNNSTER